MDRVIAYIDGFNLYFGLQSKGWQCYYWLNIRTLCESFLIDNQQLIVTKYFTSEVKGPKDKRKRQYTFIKAIETIPNVELFYGKYQVNSKDCWGCGRTMKLPVEKMTDVKLGIEMLADAYKDQYDIAFLISGDRDLVPAIEKVRMEFPNKCICVISPPRRTNSELKKVANFNLHVTASELKASLLPNPVVDPKGNEIYCPTSWQ